MGFIFREKRLDPKISWFLLFLKKTWCRKIIPFSKLFLFKVFIFLLFRLKRG